MPVKLETENVKETEASAELIRELMADALASSIDVGLGDSLVSDEFASGFARLVRAKLDRIV